MKPVIGIFNSGQGYKEIERKNVIFHFNDVYTTEEKCKYGGKAFMDVIFLEVPDDISIVQFMTSRIRRRVGDTW